MNRFRAALAAATVLLSLSACSSSTGDNAGGGTSSGAASSSAPGKAGTDLAQFVKPPARLPDWPKITSSIPKHMTVYFISGGDDTSALISKGLQGATGVLGWQLKTLTYQTSDPASLNSAMVSAINAGAGAVVFVSAPAAQVSEAISEAKSRKVALIQIGGSDPKEKAFTGQVDNVVASAPTWGRMLAASVVADAQKAGKTAHVGIVSTGSPSATAINSGFIAGLREYCPDCTAKNVDASTADLFTGRAGDDVVSAVQADPQLNYIDFALGITESGVRASLTGAGLQGVKLVGVLPAPPQLQELKSGDSTAWVVVPNELDGWLAIDSIVRAATGGDPTIHNMEPEPAWVLVQTSTFDPSSLPEVPIDYRAHFSSLWGLS